MCFDSLGLYSCELPTWMEAVDGFSLGPSCAFVLISRRFAAILAVLPALVMVRLRQDRQTHFPTVMREARVW